jgi:hypothetical protein
VRKRKSRYQGRSPRQGDHSFGILNFDLLKEVSLSLGREKRSDKADGVNASPTMRHRKNLLKIEPMFVRPVFPVAFNTGG